jgi:hypothetical protein
MRTGFLHWDRVWEFFEKARDLAAFEDCENYEHLEDVFVLVDPYKPEEGRVSVRKFYILHKNNNGGCHCCKFLGGEVEGDVIFYGIPEGAQEATIIKYLCSDCKRYIEKALPCGGNGLPDEAVEAFIEELEHILRREAWRQIRSGARTFIPPEPVLFGSLPVEEQRRYVRLMCSLGGSLFGMYRSSLFDEKIMEGLARIDVRLLGFLFFSWIAY